MLDETDDHRLALDAAGGDRAAFERLVQRESWRSEPGAVRMQDVRELVSAALEIQERRQHLKEY